MLSKSAAAAVAAISYAAKYIHQTRIFSTAGIFSFFAHADERNWGKKRSSLNIIGLVWSERSLLQKVEEKISIRLVLYSVYISIVVYTVHSKEWKSCSLYSTVPCLFGWRGRVLYIIATNVRYTADKIFKITLPAPYPAYVHTISEPRGQRG